MQARKLLVTLAALATLLAACSSTPARPPATYTVKRGDTLYAIAWRHRLDYREIARWNGIGRDYLIHPGQVLRLYPARGGAVPAPAAKARPPTSSDKKVAGTKLTVKKPAPPPVNWSWPVSGGTASLTSRPNGGSGLTISGRLGEDVHSAAAGRVVYSGSGLLGYGQLVIVKHSDTYLSAYGHTQAVHVSEGQAVIAGQRIASMGSGPQGAPMLYFEIRVNGMPTNPLTFLPPR
jgi:lipoprotein NlpD